MKGVAAVEVITIRVSLGDDRLAELNPPVGPAVAYPFS